MQNNVQLNLVVLPSLTPPLRAELGLRQHFHVATSDKRSKTSKIPNIFAQQYGNVKGDNFITILLQFYYKLSHSMILCMKGTILYGRQDVSGEKVGILCSVQQYTKSKHISKKRNSSKIKIPSGGFFMESHFERCST